MHGWVTLTIRQLVVLVGADVDERGDVAVVRAAKTKQTQAMGLKSLFIVSEWHKEERETLTSAAWWYLCGPCTAMLAGEPGRWLRSWGSKGAKVTASYSVTTKHTHVKACLSPAPQSQCDHSLPIKDRPLGSNFINSAEKRKMMVPNWQPKNENIFASLSICESILPNIIILSACHQSTKQAVVTILLSKRSQVGWSSFSVRQWMLASIAALSQTISKNQTRTRRSLWCR